MRILVLDIVGEDYGSPDLVVNHPGDLPEGICEEVILRLVPTIDSAGRLDARSVETADAVGISKDYGITEGSEWSAIEIGDAFAGQGARARGLTLKGAFSRP